MDHHITEEFLRRSEGKLARAKARKDVLWVAMSLSAGAVFWVAGVTLEWQFKDVSVATPLPHCVQLTYALCAAAYATSALLVIPKIVFDTDPTHYSLHLASLYISCLACGTYSLLSLNIPISRHDVNTIIFLPIRWTLYLATVPAIWWILAHGSHYTLHRKVYVHYLMLVTLVSGGIATVPSLRWGHKMYWMVLACVPFPEICFHLWAMLSDAIDALDVTFTSPRSLYFLRIYSLFAFQAFPAIYFAAFDGVLPLAASESLWAMSDWALKMVLTSSLMEANFLTIEQRRDRAHRRHKDRMRMRNILSLTSAIEAKDNFLATVSHELCTPLNGIIGLSYALQASQEVQLKAELSKTLTVITMSGKRLLQLIYDVLDAAKTAEDSPMIKRESVNVRALVLDVAMLCSSIVRQGVDLRVQLQPVPRIIGDTGRIVQILHNLVGNSCKFTKAGHVLIGVRYDSRLRAVALSVSDTGCGIPSEALHSVFDAFSQGLHRASEGLGLGLHLVVEFVKAHHGLIEVESEVSKGSTFTVWLPVHPDKRLLRTALRGTGPAAQELISGTVVIRNSTPESGVRSRALLASQSLEPQSPGPQPAPRHSMEARITTAPKKLQPPSSKSTTFRESLHSIGAPHRAGDTLVGPSGLPGASRPGFDIGLPVPRRMPPTAPPEPSPPPLPPLVDPCYHGEVHGVPLVFVIGSVECDHLIDYLCAEGYMIEVQTSGERALARLRNLPLLPDAMLVFSAVYDTDGLNFVSKVRQLYPMCAFPVIYLSPSVSLDILREALNTGCMDVMQWPGVNQELMWRLRSQIAMHSNKRAVLHRGAQTLRPYKVQLLPYYLRHHLALASVEDHQMDEGTPEITHLCPHTAAIHLCLDNLYDDSGTSSEQATLVQEAHSIIHQLLLHAPVCAVPGLPDGWTFIADPEATSQDVGINQFVAELVMQMEQLAQKHGRSLHPRVGVAFGAVQMSVASAVSEATFLAAGPVLTLAAAVAQQTHPGTIAFVQSHVLRSVSPGTSTVPMSLSIAGGRQVQVQAQIMPPHNAYVHCFLDGPALKALSPLHRVFACLEAARAAVHGRRRGVDLANTPSRNSAGGHRVEPLFQDNHKPASVGSPVAGTISLRNSATASTDTQGREEQLSPAGAAALSRARGRLHDANVPAHVVANEPPLDSVTQRLGVQLPQSLMLSGTGVSVIAFLEASDMPVLGMPGTEGVRLLTGCKRAFTDAILGAMNQILTKPCVRE